MINLEKTLLIVSTYPTRAVDHRITVYFTEKGLPIQNLMAVAPECSVIESRNQIVRDIVKQRTHMFDWFIFIDGDVIPNNMTDPFLDDSLEDVVGAQYDTGSPKGWLTPDQFHMGLVRVNRKVAELTKLPWFMFEYNDEGTHITKCECNHFKEILLGLDFKIARRGHAEHKPSNSWHGIRP